MSEFRRRRIVQLAAIGASVLTFAGCGLLESNEAHQDFVFSCPPRKPVPDVSKDLKYTGRELGLSVACGSLAVKLNSQRIFEPFANHPVTPLDIRVGSDASPDLRSGQTAYTFEVDSSSSSGFTVRSIEMDDGPRSATIVMEGITDPNISEPTAIAAAK